MGGIGCELPQQVGRVSKVEVVKKREGDNACK